MTSGPQTRGGVNSRTDASAVGASKLRQQIRERPRSMCAQLRGLGGSQILGSVATLFANYPSVKQANASVCMNRQRLHKRLRFRTRNAANRVHDHLARLGNCNG
jgi:hypothetical protein